MTYLPSWLPDEIREELRNCHVPFDDRTMRLVSDDRMRSVWEWFEAGRPYCMVPHREGSTREVTPADFLACMTSSTYFPGKPSDLAPKQRQAYLAKVEKHAKALKNLLENTEFDRDVISDPTNDILRHTVDSAVPIDFNELYDRVVTDLALAIGSSKDENLESTVAFQISKEGNVYRLPRSYPKSHLVSILSDLVQWTKRDDYFDDEFSIRHVKQSGLAARKSSFLYHLHQAMQLLPKMLPYEHYATITNVALNLDIERQLDEETARKQIARMIERDGSQQ